MELGKITGQVVSTARHPKLPHMTLLLVDIVDVEDRILKKDQVAADSFGAGIGELVMLSRGSAARLIHDTESPIDLCVIGIIDQISSGQKSLYTK
jgi:microcompartment protein CcmK/EutM